MVIAREQYYKMIQAAFRSLPIVALLGARQVGKTTIMKNVPLTKQSVYLNGQDPDVQVLFQRLPDISEYLKINLNKELNGYLLLDEFQFIPNISTMLKLLTDQNSSLKILCSGSSSLGIFEALEESLTGRLRIIEVFPLSFPEYILFSDEELYRIYQRFDLDTKDPVVHPELKLKFDEYLLFGGFPRVALTTDREEKVELLNDIYQSYLLKDVRQYVRQMDVIGFNKLVKLLSAQISNLANVNELSRISGLNYKKCEEYLFLLEQMYIIKLAPPHITNKRKSISKMKKVYYTDIGLRNLIYNNFNEMEFRVDNGMIFENYVFNTLANKIPRYGQLTFFRTINGTEIDFIVDILSQKTAFEVKWKQFEEPLSMRKLKQVAVSIDCREIFLINRNLNAHAGNLHYVQGYLLDKWQPRRL